MMELLYTRNDYRIILNYICSMKRLLLLILYIIALIPCKAQTIVCDTQDGQPIIQASVYDEQGKLSV